MNEHGKPFYVRPFPLVGNISFSKTWSDRPHSIQRDATDPDGPNPTDRPNSTDPVRAVQFDGQDPEIGKKKQLIRRGRGTCAYQNR